MSKTSKIGIQDVMAIFAVSHVTVYNWRKKGKDGKVLATAALTKAENALPRPPVNFSLPTVLAWAKKAGIEVADQAYVKNLAGGTDSVPATKSVSKAKAKKAPLESVAAALSP